MKTVKHAVPQEFKTATLEELASMLHKKLKLQDDISYSEIRLPINHSEILIDVYGENKLLSAVIHLISKSRFEIFIEKEDGTKGQKSFFIWEIKAIPQTFSWASWIRSSKNINKINSLNAVTQTVEEFMVEMDGVLIG